MSTVSTLSRAWRGAREHTYLAIVSTGVIAAAVLLAGLYALVVFNLRAAVDGWEKDVNVSAYFVPTISAETRIAAQAALTTRPDVAAVRYVSEAEAQAWMTARMPELAPVFAELGADALPASLEVTLRRGHSTAGQLSAFAADLKTTGLYDDIDYGQEWVARIHTGIEIFSILGIGLGVLIAMSALFLVGNTIHLVVFARRDELEIMRLVGATDRYILSPFLVEGAAQGALGATIALGLLYLSHAVLAAKVGMLLPVAFGSAAFPFLSASWLLMLFTAGVAVGCAAAWGAVKRFLGQVP